MSAPRDRAAWLGRLETMLSEIQPELAPLALSEETLLGEDLGLDSLAFEDLFARLKAELTGPVDMIAWFNRLEAEGARVGVLLDLIAAQQDAHARA